MPAALFTDGQALVEWGQGHALLPLACADRVALGGKGELSEVTALVCTNSSRSLALELDKCCDEQHVFNMAGACVWGAGEWDPTPVLPSSILPTRIRPGWAAAHQAGQVKDCQETRLTPHEADVFLGAAPASLRNASSRYCLEREVSSEEVHLVVLRCKEDLPGYNHDYTRLVL